ncbi:MAG: membrane protein insertion efficiency factor YidD [Planctomycetes bacterium]|nr:membrane protein insertion efficiency factor YidD [Planctomycetota bacterium]
MWKKVGRFLRLIGKPVEWLLIALVELYRLTISRITPSVCRFTPTCSEYMAEALRKKGPLIGLLKGIWRIMRCNPFCKGGYDPVEPPDKTEEETEMTNDGCRCE